MLQDSITQYRVFIASPSGLESERKTFRSTITEFNEMAAEPHGVRFVPVGWETTTGGVDRLQSLVNKDVRRSDYVVVVFGPRWGSSPNRKGKGVYSSGTEEEYHVALDCYRDGSKRMKNVIVCFKDVEPGHLRTPGEQLRKVLKFKKTLQKEKTLCHQFRGRRGFQGILRRHLVQWLDDHESGRGGKGAGLPQPSPEPVILSPSPPIQRRITASSVATFLKNSKFVGLECLYALQQSCRKKRPLLSQAIIDCRGRKFYYFFYGFVVATRAMGLVRFSASHGVWTVREIHRDIKKMLDDAIACRLGPKRAGPFKKLNDMLGVEWPESPSARQ